MPPLGAAHGGQDDAKCGALEQLLLLSAGIGGGDDFSLVTYTGS